MNTYLFSNLIWQFGYEKKRENEQRKQIFILTTSDQLKQMVQKLKRAASDRAYLDTLLAAQRQQAEMGSVAMYQEVLGS